MIAALLPQRRSGALSPRPCAPAFRAHQRLRLPLLLVCERATLPHKLPCPLLCLCSADRVGVLRSRDNGRAPSLSRVLARSLARPAFALKMSSSAPSSPCSSSFSSSHSSAAHSPSLPVAAAPAARPRLHLCVIVDDEQTTHRSHPIDVVVDSYPSALLEAPFRMLSSNRKQLAPLIFEESSDIKLLEGRAGKKGTSRASLLSRACCLLLSSFSCDAFSAFRCVQALLFTSSQSLCCICWTPCTINCRSATASCWFRCCVERICALLSSNLPSGMQSRRNAVTRC